MQKGKSGFTLIELLVVVLIIGILSAIALPQYQKAVLKSRMSELMINTAAIAHSMDMYYLANDAYPEDDDANISTLVLDTAIAGCSESTGGIFNCQKSIYDFEDTGLVGGFLKNYYGLGYIYFCAHSNSSWGTPNSRECWADSTNTTANQVCLSMGGVLKGTNWWRVGEQYEHTKNTWNTYLLP